MSAPLENAAPRPPGDTWRMVRTLGGISLLSGFLIVFAYETTLPRILANRQRAIEEGVFRVLPGATARATYLIDGDAIRLATSDATAGQKFYAGYDDQGKLVGVAIEAAGQGYQDVIRVLYGYSPDGQRTTGFTVVESKETPGLGDKIGSDPQFMANFDGLALDLNGSRDGLQHEVVAVKHGTKKEPWQIDGISGATISSKAVARIVNESAGRLLPVIVNNLDRIRAKQ